jgi:hypothetical protein
MPKRVLITEGRQREETVATATLCGVITGRIKNG